jgi:ssDNA-binding Zn-finger/Zn-ribbon topoisomerase 1
LKPPFSLKDWITIRKTAQPVDEEETREWDDPRLETCDLCGDHFPIREIRFTGVQFLCPAHAGQTLSER